jgi:NAD(P)-dependent dehydrogenase (short-subunit alcohol dehydrogenase family)
METKHRSTLDGKVALITGGTTGNGAANAKRVAERGGSVVITGRRRDLAQSVVDEFGERAVTRFPFRPI